MSEWSGYMRRLIEEQERIRKMLGPSEHITRLIKEQEKSRKMFEPPEHIKKMIEEQERIRTMFGPSEHIMRLIREQKTFKKMFDPPEYIKDVLEEHEKIRKMFEPPEHIKRMVEEQETFRKMFGHQSAVEKMFQDWTSGQGLDYRAITNSIKNLADEISYDDIDISNDGIVSVDGQSITASDLNATVFDFFNLTTKDSSPESIFSHIRKLKRPAQQIIIWILDHIFVALVVTIMGNVYTADIQNFLSTSPLRSKREVTQTIKNLPQGIYVNEFKGFRVVTADVLNIREKPNMKALIIGKVKRGNLVRIIQKKKNWTKVEVENSDSDSAEIGWVTTRHIVRIKR